MDFTRLRLSSSPATSPRIVDAPASPTKSVYLDMDEATPTSPQLPSSDHHDSTIQTRLKDDIKATRRTNFFDDDSSDEEEELATADELAFSQRHSQASIPDQGSGDEQGARGRPLTRYSTTTSLSPTTTTTTTHGVHRKDAFYLGVRPEEYAFVCGTHPASSTLPDDDYDDARSPPTHSPARGLLDGYSRYDVPSIAMSQHHQQRQTLRSEGVSPKHVPFGAPDLAVAARRVLSEQRRKKKATRDKEREKFLRVRASSSVLPYSASEYEDGSMAEGYGGSGVLNGRAVSCSAGVNGVSYGDGVLEGIDKDGDEVVETQSLQDKTDQNILGVHAITLQALLRNEDGLQASASSVRRKSASSEFSRRELLKLQGKSDSATSLPPPVPEIPPMAQIQQPKRVSLVPPPIDTSRPPKSKGEGKIRTPYPFHHHRKFPKTLGSPGFPPPPTQDTILTLSIRRRSGVLSSRVARITLPAELLEGKYAAGSFGDDIAPDEQPPPLFDDAAFFEQLRVEYARLAGRWWRFFSARSLRRVTVGHTTAWSATESCPGPAACGGGRCCPAARAAHGSNEALIQHQEQQQRGCSAATPSGIYHVRSPRFLASQGLKDTFSEENLLAHFHKPRLGRSRFAWVLWASRLAGLHEQPDLSSWRAQQRQKDVSWRDRELPPTPAAAAAGRTPSAASTAFAGASSDDDNAKDDFFVAQAELGLAGGGGGGIAPGHSIATLEFVEGWSIARILTVVLLVLLLAAAGIVLWILFGTGTLVDGIRGSGARVGTAVLIGTGVLFFGWSMVLVWMGISWCVV